MRPTCPICGGPTLRIDAKEQLMVCKCMQVTFTFSDSTTAYPLLTEDFSKFFNHGWNMTTLDVTIDGAREPVPDAFQSAFRDGELEL